ncbi:LysR family transcriptional regulator [Alloyangia pacifica]|uniref:DNA-binding transcriptional regulator, LysR family n=1 Tax=Alloyangia pacifica TaxID=311180 RepID=A0A1I6QZS7_9RHOB|nr:LysR family transcriptional regulator [Alloyangia pacifica]SDG08124.1 DNA-binding transcriptional regulator, LysR family [Alloyangia pacifica]SFS57902.1 DNA-binding transcriptional regulator, LysR family [Alloyangia pacifica]
MKSRFRSWTDVRTFLAVLREGSTLAASRRLGLAQPTVARRIEALEHELGLVLFDRDTRGFRPTAAAQALRPHAEAMEAAAEAMADCAEAQGRPRPIRITAFSANFSPRVTQVFSAFSAEHPEVRFEFLPGVKPLDLLGGEADIALRITRSTPEPELICRKISTARFTLYGAPSYAARHGLPSSPGEMGGHVFVTYEPETIPSVYHDWLRPRVAPAQIVLSFTEIGLHEAAILSGHGLGVLNLRMAEADEAAGRLIRCFAPPEEMTAQHLMLISPEAWRRPEVKAFTRFFAPRYAALFRDPD